MHLINLRRNVQISVLQKQGAIFGKSPLHWWFAIIRKVPVSLALGVIPAFYHFSWLNTLASANKLIVSLLNPLSLFSTSGNAHSIHLTEKWMKLYCKDSGMKYLFLNSANRFAKLRIIVNESHIQNWMNGKTVNKCE